MTCVHCGQPLPEGSTSCPSCGRPQTALPAEREGDEPTLVPARTLDVLEGKWRLERKLGEGGMGIVYLAHDLQLDRKVAVKLLSARLAGDAELVSRFAREVRLTAGLEHPNIVPVYSVGQYHGRPFMVMKALEGRTLALLLREKGALGPAELLHIARQVAAGLDFIHSKGFIHRDIKAGNIFIGPDGHATILDFGILRPSRGAEALTRTGMVMGTPQYMSPEQAKGVRELDHRSDIYALAVLVFECASGALPFESHSDLAVVQMQAHTPAPDIRERAPSVPAEVAGVLARALAKNPDERYATAGELVRALEAAFSGQALFVLGTPVSASGAILLTTPSNPALPAQPVSPAGGPPPAGAAVPALPVSGAVAPSTAELARGLKVGRIRRMATLGLPLLLLAAVGLFYALRGTSAGPVAVHEQGGPDAPPAVQEPAPQGQGTAQAPGPGAVQAPAPPQPPSQEPAAVEEPAVEEPVPLAKPGPETPAPSGKPRGSGSGTEPAVHRVARGPARLRVITTRKGESYWATVLVDGERKGTTPLLLEVAPGAHRIRVERIGFKPVERQITVASGRSTVLRIPLAP